MKKSKSKGFTLIELMVVISIISLLSSIVLASIKTAREKAVITKTVGEMKSLQTALELYRNQFGVYPVPAYVDGIGPWVDDDDNKIYTQVGGSEVFFKTELVDKKLIAKVPHAPNYPNNCGSNCQTKGYVLGYSTDKYINDSMYYTCGGNKINNYIIYFIANSKKINLPFLYRQEYSTVFNVMTSNSNLNLPPYVYCLAM